MAAKKLRAPKTLGPLIVHILHDIPFIFIYHDQWKGVTRVINRYPEEIKREWIDNSKRIVGMGHVAATQFVNHRLSEAVKILPYSDQGRVWLFGNMYVALRRESNGRFSF